MTREYAQSLIPCLENNSKNSRRMREQGGRTMLCSHLGESFMHDIIKHCKRFLLSFYLNCFLFTRDRITRQRNECFTAFKWVPDGLCLVQPDGAGHLSRRDSGRKRADTTEWAWYGTGGTGSWFANEMPGIPAQGWARDSWLREAGCHN